MPDYSKHDPRGWCGDPSRGAAMGRHAYHEDGFSGVLHVQRVPLRDGGYDVNGTYFGDGAPLYWIANEESTVDFVVRERDLDAAIATCAMVYPAASVAEDAGLREMVAEYARTALWSSCGDDDRPLDNAYSVSDIDEETLAGMRCDCASFLENNGAAVGSEYARAGHDLWLTRNRHGAGFWDGGWEHGDALTDAARAMGGVDLYVGDDGKVYAT